MTERELAVLCTLYEVHAPVTLDDVRAIYQDLRSKVPETFALDVVNRGHEILVTVGHPMRCRRSIPIG